MNILLIKSVNFIDVKLTILIRSLILCATLLAGSLFLPVFLFANNKVELNKRAIEIIQKKDGVYLYSYEETLEPIDPLNDYTRKYRIFNNELAQKLENLIVQNKHYEPEYKAKCLPVWDYGLEFRSKQESHLFLFSFRCKTIKYVNENLFKDFTPQSIDFYKIFKYEVDDKTALLLDEK